MKLTFGKGNPPNTQHSLDVCKWRWRNPALRDFVEHQEQNLVLDFLQWWFQMLHNEKKTWTSWSRRGGSSFCSHQNLALLARLGELYNEKWRIVAFGASESLGFLRKWENFCTQWRSSTERWRRKWRKAREWKIIIKNGRAWAWWALKMEKDSNKRYFGEMI
jgi:hypothetical protein